MPLTGNYIGNNALAVLSKQAPSHIQHAIQKASTKTGVDFAYLMEQAAAESSFNAHAEAKTSSATGLYQFIESTWMNMVKQYGHKHGLGNYAKQIDENGNVADKGMKQRILNLRKNPEKAALLAAEFAAENKRHLEQYADGKIGPTELYFAHFMGASGATGFLNAKQENPLQIGADLFPKEARANRNVFYDQKTGEPRTLAGIYDFFDKKFSDTLAEPSHVPPMEEQNYMTARQILSTFLPMQDRNIMDFVLHPALKSFAPGLAMDWHPSFFPASTVFNPVEIMMMARENT
jgi:hypothetical protein